MKRSHRAALLLLCLWASAQWIAADALPSQLGSVTAEGAHLLVLAALTSIYAALRGSPHGSLGTTLAGTALLAVPSLLLHASSTMVSSSLAVVIYALLPIAIAVATSQMRWLPPSLASLAGLLLLLPVTAPETPRGYLGLILMVLAMSITAGAILFLSRRTIGPWDIAATAMLGGLILLAGGSPERGWTMQSAEVEALRALLFDVPQILLLLYLIPRVSPRRLSARWLLAPFLTVVEGYAIMHPPMNTRLLAGALLLAGGSIYVLAAKDESRATQGLGL